jgi:hypothetical protein
VLEAIRTPLDLSWATPHDRSDEVARGAALLVMLGRGRSAPALWARGPAARDAATRRRARSSRRDPSIRHATHHKARLGRGFTWHRSRCGWGVRPAPKVSRHRSVALPMTCPGMAKLVVHHRAQGDPEADSLVSFLRPREQQRKVTVRVEMRMRPWSPMGFPSDHETAVAGCG